MRNPRSRRSVIMTRVIFVGFVAVCMAAPAAAQERAGRGLGLGIQAQIGALSSASQILGPGGAASVEYDLGAFYLAGLLNFVRVEDVATMASVGGRFYYIVHS